MDHVEDLTTRPFPDDPHSHSRPNEIVVRHVSLDLAVDFDERRISGRPRWTWSALVPDATELVLDTWQLDIAAVTLGDGTHALFELGSTTRSSGSRSQSRSVTPSWWSCTTPSPRSAGGAVAGAGADGVGQAVPVHPVAADPARSGSRCRTARRVRVTYDADRARAAGPAGADECREPDRTHAPTASTGSAMPQPVPAYLMALAVGDLEFRVARRPRTACTPSRRWSTRPPGSSPTPRR